MQEAALLSRIEALKEKRDLLNEQLKTTPLDQRWRIHDAICRICSLLQMLKVA